MSKGGEIGNGVLNLLAQSEIRLRSRHPAEVMCPHCSQQVITSVDPKPGAAAYLFCVLLILCGCVLGCCLIPLFWNRTQDIRHECPNCHALIGVTPVF